MLCSVLLCCGLLCGYAVLALVVWCLLVLVSACCALVLVVVVWSASWAGSVLRPFFVARAILSQRAITRNTQ